MMKDSEGSSTTLFVNSANISSRLELKILLHELIEKYKYKKSPHLKATSITQQPTFPLPAGPITSCPYLGIFGENLSPNTYTQPWQALNSKLAVVTTTNMAAEKGRHILGWLRTSWIFDVIPKHNLVTDMYRGACAELKSGTISTEYWLL